MKKPLIALAAGLLLVACDDSSPAASPPPITPKQVTVGSDRYEYVRFKLPDGRELECVRRRTSGINFASEALDCNWPKS